MPGLCSRQVACRYRVPRSLHRLQVSRAVAKRRRPAEFSLELATGTAILRYETSCKTVQVYVQFRKHRGGGGALSYISYIHVGMCGAKGMAFRADLV